MRSMPMQLSILLILSFGFSPKQESSRVQLLLTRQLNAREIIGKTGQVWFGLYDTPDGCELRKSKITVTKYANGPEDSLFLADVTIDQSLTPLFLVRGLTRLRSGPVRTMFCGSTYLRPSQTVIFKFSDTSHSLEASGKPDHEIADHYELTLFHNGILQK